MFTYRIYGLNIRSTRPISLLADAEFDTPDIIVEWHTGFSFETDSREFNRVDTEMLDLLDEVTLWELTEGSGTVTKVDISTEKNTTLTFMLDSNGARLDIYHEPEESRDDLESYFVGPIMSFVLRLRGNVCLHASSVAIDGKAIAFVGHSTAGKSTLAAGMASAGASILADDITALTEDKDVVLVQPGYSRVRLRPTAADFLTPAREKLPRVYSYRDSFYYALQNEGKFESRALPLAAIYFLGKFSDEYLDPFVAAVDPQQRLISLVENVSGIYVVRGARRAAEFEVLSKIAREIPIRRLHYSHDISTLPKQCEIILEDFRGLSR